MAAFIKLPNGQIWKGSGTMYYLMLESIQRADPQGSSLGEAVNFGIESGTKFCDLSTCSDEELFEVNRVVDCLLKELHREAQSWKRPEFLSTAQEEVSSFLRVLRKNSSRGGAGDEGTVE